jgi:acetylornithine/succinyldiaminopimelate/putrescine aminotransferase/predicted amino acid dehydrogenase
MRRDNVPFAKVETNPERERLLRFAGLDREFVRGEGVWLVDTFGRRYLDAYSQFGVHALGHNPPAVLAALRGAMEAGVPAMVQPYSSPHARALAGELYALAGGQFSRCVFTTSGVETVEAAIKLARMRTGRPLVISATGSYHGKTLGALAASDRQGFEEQHAQAASGFARVPFGDAQALEAFLAIEGQRTAAFIVEPIQGERGVFCARPGYLAAARDACSRHGVAFIADEIQTGLHRTGPAFAIHDEGVVPDILLVAKALGGGVFPIGACLANERFWDEDFALAHSSTFANNSLACIAGLAVLRKMGSEEFRQNAARSAQRLNDGVAALAIRFPRAIREVRGRGMLRAIELAAPGPDAGYFLTYLHEQGLSAFLFASVLAHEQGVLVLPALNDAGVVRVAPPLVATPEHIERILAALAATLAWWEAGATDRIASSVMSAGATPPANGDRLVLPRARRRVDAIDYAFVIHPTTIDDILGNDPALARLAPRDFDAFVDFLPSLPPGVVCEVDPIASPSGACVRGALVGVPMLPAQMADRGRAAVSEAIGEAVDLARSRGARVVGLGAFASIYSRRGAAVTGRGPAITTGNLLTAGMTFRALEALLGERGATFGEVRVGVVGARGSVGQLVAQLCARARPREMRLVGNPHGERGALERLARRLGGDAVTACDDITGIASCDVIVSASSSPSYVLDAVEVKPGAIVCDVARPFDASPTLRARADVTVIDAGLVALPGAPVRMGIGNLQGHPPGIALACLSETILLALAHARGEAIADHGVGDDVDVAAVDAILALAERHGFSLAQPIVTRTGGIR